MKGSTLPPYFHGTMAAAKKKLCASVAMPPATFRVPSQ
jgi:hypothetical protein